MDPRPPHQIFFATRTHSQVAQIVRELRSTTYRPKMAVLGSRDQYCVHPTVGRSKDKNQECKKLLKAHPPDCMFKRNVQGLIDSPLLQPGGDLEVWDIEDLVSAAQTTYGCPYFASKGIAKSAELIICPYNYLLSPSIRSSLNINIDQAVMIFDEAHNIEDALMEEASCEFSVAALRLAVDDVQRCLAFEQDQSQLPNSLRALLNWARETEPTLATTDFEVMSRTFTGAQLVKVLDDCRLGPSSLPTHLKILNELSVLDDEAKFRDRDEDHPGGGSQLNAASIGLLSSLFTTLKFLYGEPRFVQDYRLVLQKTPQQHGEWALQIYLWCLNPGICFQSLKASRCILLTSGTLSPMTSFDSELEVEFPIRMSWRSTDIKAVVGAQLTSRGVSLDARWQPSERLDYQDALGEAIRSYLAVIPGGVLVFLPSYGFQAKLLARWEVSGERQKMEELKRIYREPRGGGEEFDRMLASYYMSVQQGGAVMFAVCRGKVSEGIDFADNNARAVLAVGIPFPSTQDLRVKLKKAHNTAHKNRGLLDGQAWYTLQGYRALNQALGRCIRHKQDFGAIILLDSRFQEAGNCTSLSSWAAGMLRIASGPELVEACRVFFEEQQATYVPNSTWQAKAPSQKLLEASARPLARAPRAPTAPRAPRRPRVRRTNQASGMPRELEENEEEDERQPEAPTISLQSTLYSYLQQKQND